MNLHAKRLYATCCSVIKNGIALENGEPYTLEPAVSVILNVECGLADREAIIEKCFSMARTVCRKLEENGIKYDFSTNAIAAGALSNWSDIGEGLGHKHFYSILEGLGRATYDTSMPYEALVSRAAESSSTGRGRILITPGGEEKEPEGMKRLREISNGNLLMITAKEVRQC